jgi:hypothetical protein
MWLGKYPEAEERGGIVLSHFLPSCPPSLRVLPPFMSIDEAEPILLYVLGDFFSFVRTVHSASPPPPSLCVLPPFVSSLPPFMSFLPSCPSSLHVLPPFVSFFHPCPSSLRVLPPIMSNNDTEPVLLYLLGGFLSFVGVVHSASPPLPSCLILSVMKSNILPSLGLTKDTYHIYISLHGLLVRDPPPLCLVHSS